MNRAAPKAEVCPASGAPPEHFTTPGMGLCSWCHRRDVAVRSGRMDRHTARPRGGERL